VATAGSLGLRSYALIQTREDKKIEVNLPDVQLARSWNINDVPRQARWEGTKKQLTVPSPYFQKTKKIIEGRDGILTNAQFFNHEITCL
jgi:hypothetical protein